MSRFLITFDPPLPSAVTAEPSLDLAGVDVATVVAAYPHEHNVLISIDESIFAYCPASILTVLNDIHLEWMLIRERVSHDVTLSGYTVLEAIFEQERVQFHSPAWPPAAVGDKFDATYLEDMFQAATARVWGVVRSIQDRA